MTLKMSDMGNYGCFLDCIERISLPLHVVARVNLIRKRPLSSLAAHGTCMNDLRVSIRFGLLGLNTFCHLVAVLGSVIVVESLVVFSLAIVLLFFTCKCAFLLVHERRSEHSVHMNPQKPTVVKRLISLVFSYRHFVSKYKQDMSLFWTRTMPNC